MSAVLAISCEVPQADIRAFESALARYQTETRRDMKGAVRSAAIDLVKSLRKRTRKAPKTVPRADVRFGDALPKHLTRNGKDYRRVLVSRWAKGRRTERTHFQEVSVSRAATLREARARFGAVRNWGLAKKSWGWFMRSLFGSAVQDENPRAKLKPGMVGGGVADRNGEYTVTIENKLDYIRAALVPGALSASLRAAANSINKKITMGLKSRRFGA